MNNEILQSLTGLENIAPASILDLNIYNNPQLSECAVSSICDYLIDPNGSVDIHDNAPGCDNQDQVYLACWSSDDEIAINTMTFTISPNPSSGKVYLQLVISDRGIVICNLYTISGIKIMELLNEEKIDLKGLPAGIYYCVLKTMNGIQTTKLLKS